MTILSVLFRLATDQWNTMEHSLILATDEKMRCAVEMFAFVLDFVASSFRRQHSEFCTDNFKIRLTHCSTCIHSRTRIISLNVLEVLNSPAIVGSYCRRPSDGSCSSFEARQTCGASITAGTVVSMKRHPHRYLNTSSLLLYLPTIEESKD